MKYDTCCGSQYKKGWEMLVYTRDEHVSEISSWLIKKITYDDDTQM